MLTVLGRILTLFIFGHASATRFLPAYLDIDIELSFVTHSIQELFGFSFFIYYLVLGFSGAYHMINGTTIAFRRFGFKVTATKKNLLAVFSVVALGVFGAMLQLSGYMYDIDLPPRYGAIHELFM
eukprot:TRINITY_DN1107_c0_g1_i1.p1 TRINITY_DN1107_c0_g1~~TRINITY_DN1107_c0_g1_i1.p1  ORF type:complete len:125 (-),score=11.00 TRINITY_DN1107_c0_g1_i1:38-412(-)